MSSKEGNDVKNLAHIVKLTDFGEWYMAYTMYNKLCLIITQLS